MPGVICQRDQSCLGLSEVGLAADWTAALWELNFIRSANEHQGQSPWCPVDADSSSWNVYPCPQPVWVCDCGSAAALLWVTLGCHPLTRVGRCENPGWVSLNCFKLLPHSKITRWLWWPGHGGEQLVECLSFPLVFLGVAFRLGTGTSSWKMRGISSSQQAIWGGWMMPMVLLCRLPACR